MWNRSVGSVVPTVAGGGRTTTTAATMDTGTTRDIAGTGVTTAAGDHGSGGEYLSARIVSAQVHRWRYGMRLPVRPESAHRFNGEAVIYRMRPTSIARTHRRSGCAFHESRARTSRRPHEREYELPPRFRCDQVSQGSRAARDN